MGIWKAWLLARYTLMQKEYIYDDRVVRKRRGTEWGKMTLVDTKVEVKY